MIGATSVRRRLSPRARGVGHQVRLPRRALLPGHAARPGRFAGGGGNGLGNTAIEHARDDVLLVELLLADQPGYRPGRRQLHPVIDIPRLDFERPRPRVDLDVDAEGRAFVGWTGGATGADRPRLAESGPSGRFRKLDVASVGGVSGVLADVAVGRDGGRLALWTTTELGFGEAVMASVDDGTGGGFGPAELVAGYGDVRTPRGAVAGFAAVAFVDGGRVRVAWRRPWCASVPLARCSY